MKSWSKSDLLLFWQYIKAGWQVMKTAYVIRTTLRKSVVTIFGSAQLAQDSFYSQQAYELAKKLTNRGYSILTGGGPGIMNAANCGASSVGAQAPATLGIGVDGIDEGFTSGCGRSINVSQFFGRQWLLMRYSCAFVFFPGGIGTLDEFFELLTACKHNYVKRLPIILVGTQFWQPIVDWYAKALADGYIIKDNGQLFYVTDDPDHILIHCKNNH